jgi:outer membrane protein assembly factor BamE (lipoprotein component of BamABCDE complex)
MKKSFIASLVVSAALLGLSGCASDQGQKTDQAQNPEPAKKTQPPKDTRPIEQRLAVGMTKDDVRKALGDPSGTSVDNTGMESWRYTDTAKHFIPYYAISGGKFQTVIVNFDADGKVKTWASSSQSAY